MKGMGTNNTQKDRQWILENQIAVYTLHAQFVPTDIWGRERLGNTKAVSMDHKYGGDIQGGSIAISGLSKFAIYPAECGLPSMFFFI